MRGSGLSGPVGLREGDLQIHAVIYVQSPARQQRLLQLLAELDWVCTVESSLENLHHRSADAWALIAEVTPDTHQYFDRLSEGLERTAFCALVAREDVKAVEGAKNFSRWRLVETPYRDEHFIEQLAGALLDKC